jgi:hypothetical protein
MAGNLNIAAIEDIVCIILGNRLNLVNLPQIHTRTCNILFLELIAKFGLVATRRTDEAYLVFDVVSSCTILILLSAATFLSI